MSKRKTKKKLKVLFVASECAPIAKAGGLGDVVGSLPLALEKLGCDAKMVIPKYEAINDKKFSIKKNIKNLKIPIEGRKEKINIFKTKLPNSQGIEVYLPESKKFFGGEDMYTHKRPGTSFIYSFVFLSRTALEITKAIKFKPDVIHLHDWHTSFIPLWLRTTFEDDPFYKDIATLLTIHNLAHQGEADINLLKFANLKVKDLDLLGWDAHDKDVVILFQGIVLSDLINTVSPTYAKEILTKEYGRGLDKILQKRKDRLFGVVNGINYDFFNPKKDKNIFQNYDSDSLDNRLINKVELQEKLKLDCDSEAPIIGMISRITSQKGFDLLDKIMKEIENLNFQFVLLGVLRKTESKKMVKAMFLAAKKYPKRVSLNLEFDPVLANQIYAASDIFLMPSRFEPCGLGQMIAMRYGAVPLVRKTGGLADTVLDFDKKTEKGTGFVFKKYNSRALYNTLRRALNVYRRDREAWRKIMIQDMRKDFTWDRSARQYLKLYKKAIKFHKRGEDLDEKIYNRIKGLRVKI